ncbi:MAG TPA: ATPase, T2SS/T4P/T4SS family [Phycisphaerales bacterium]|nr:ATPase, T2SS/T4P/T4SS family [Phycisphaerales bacterium]
MSKRRADDLLNELAAEPARPEPVARDDTAMTDLYSPEDEPAADDSRGLGDLLVSRGVVKRERLTSAEQVIRQSPGRRLADVLVEQGVDEAEVQRAIAELARVPFERIDLDRGLDGGFDGRLLQRLAGEFFNQHLVVPLRTEGTRVVIGATRPDDVFLLDEIRARLGVHAVKLVIVTAFEVRAALEIVGQSDRPEPDLSAILEDVDEADVEVDAAKQANEVDLEQQAGESPVIRYVNYIIQTAVKEGASDIHVEPSEKKLKVRFRIDGVLFEMMNPPVSMAAAITSRLKIMANLDISERRLPQDGRIRCTVQGRKLDLRMSTIPTPAGEKTVMRLLDTRSINVQLEELGFAENTLELWRRQVNAPHGIVLVTGPTGSGKTTTLYSSLRQLDKNKLNISTVEDPIEYHLDGVTQTQTHDRIGMSFARALRALLRQDPDVIMVGEIRDQETAHVAVQAALTGHLVLSTLHTNDAPSSITRLVNIGIEPFLVGAAVNAVLAQRLVRRLCTACKTQEPPDGEMAEYLAMMGLGAETIWAAHGCDRCRNTGYSGRVGVYELLVVDDQLRDVIARNPNVSEFRRMCLERGMVSLRDDGMVKVAKGQTTVQEVLRVTESAV